MKKYATAEARFRLEHSRLSPFHQSWGQALAAVAAAKEAVSTAQAAAQPAVDAIVAEYKPQVEAADEALEILKQPAFNDEIKAVWNCQAPTCPTADPLIHASSDYKLGTLLSGVKALHSQRKKALKQHLKELEKQNKENAEAADKVEAEAAEPPGEEGTEGEATGDIEPEEEEAQPTLKEYPHKFCLEVQYTLLQDRLDCV